jgi:hypothetical protein
MTYCIKKLYYLQKKRDKIIPEISSLSTKKQPFIYFFFSSINETETLSAIALPQIKTYSPLLLLTISPVTTPNPIPFAAPHPFFVL